MRFQDPQQLEVGGVDRLAQETTIEHQGILTLLEPDGGAEQPLVRRPIAWRRVAKPDFVRCPCIVTDDHPHTLQAVSNDQLGEVTAGHDARVGHPIDQTCPGPRELQRQFGGIDDQPQIAHAVGDRRADIGRVLHDIVEDARGLECVRCAEMEAEAGIVDHVRDEIN
jgi:hypothetical protein